MKKLILSIVIILVISISIGYSAFQSNLTISNIGAFVNVTEYAKITDFYYVSSSNANSANETYGNNHIYMDVSLPNQNSTITYELEATNFGNIEMALSKIEGLPENLTYELSDYGFSEPICDNNNKCTLGASKKFKLTIKYKNNGFNSANTSYALNLEFIFKTIHNISYLNYYNANHSKYICDGEDLIIDFSSENLVIEYIKIGGIDLSSSDYEFIDGILRVENVTADILIKFEVPEGVLPTVPITTDEGVEFLTGIQSDFISGDNISTTSQARFENFNEEYDNATRTYHLTITKKYVFLQSIRPNYESFDLNFKVRNDSDITWTNGTVTMNYSSTGDCLSNVSGVLDKTTILPQEEATLNMKFRLKIYGKVANTSYDDQITYVITYLVNGEERTFNVIIDFISD